MEFNEAKDYKQTIDDLESAEFLLKRAKKELINVYSEKMLSANSEPIHFNKTNYNDCLKMARKLLLESYAN